jgi:hypothetical protein
LFLHSNLRVVVCGHSHQAVRIRLATGASAVMNARGYRSETGTGYSPRATFRV